MMKFKKAGQFVPFPRHLPISERKLKSQELDFSSREVDFSSREVDFLSQELDLHIISGEKESAFGR